MSEWVEPELTELGYDVDELKQNVEDLLEDLALTKRMVRHHDKILQDHEQAIREIREEEGEEDE